MTTIPSWTRATFAVIAVITISWLQLAAPTLAADSAPLLDSEARNALIESIAADLETVYIFPEVATDMVQHLRTQAATGAYDSLNQVSAFTLQLTVELQKISKDLHLSLRPIPPSEVGLPQAGQEDSEELRRRYLAAARRGNYGFDKVEILPGNVGYLELMEFAEAETGGAAAVAALGFLANTDALIIDLRGNGGGSPSMVQLISSYFFAEPTHLNSFYIRHSDSTTQFWTQAHVEGARLTDLPLYILTSGRTFSAAEEFSYNMRHLQRATLVGETTGGGAHPVESMRYPQHGVVMSLPFGRAVNPITGTNWEGAGVEPHVAVPADTALEVAHSKALKAIDATATDPAQQAALQWTLAGLEATPRQLTPQQQSAYVGEFGPRKIHQQDGNLAYQRGDGPLFPLIAVGADEFHLDGVDYFRLHFKRNSAGHVTHLVGRYDDGREDTQRRTKP